VPGTKIHLQSDGTVDSAQTFTLEDPARLVDRPARDEEQGREEDDWTVGSPQVARVRVGQPLTTRCAW
jgi:hypothetical protein